jgi:DNA-binding GntR family transcriptional regulator
MTRHQLPQKWPQAARGGRADAIYRGIFEAVVEHRLPPGA